MKASASAMLNAMWNFAVILVIGLERGEIVGEGMEKRQYEGYAERGG